MLRYLSVATAAVVVMATTLTMAGGMDYAIVPAVHTTTSSDWCGSDRAKAVAEELEYAKALEWFYSDADYEGDVRTAERYAWRKSWPCGGC